MRRKPKSERSAAPGRPVIVAGAQFAVQPNDPAANLERCRFFLERAAADVRARLVVFPESITTGFNPALAAPELFDLLPPTARLLAPIQEICRARRIHCVLPTYERGPRHGIVYNSAFLIDARGKNLGAYRKTHLFPTERLQNRGWSTPGHRYPVFDTEIGRIGIHICYDGDFPEVARILALKGAQILCRPAALLRHFEIWEASNKMRAYENHVHHIAVNAVGSDAAGTHYFGHSMIISPIAQTLALGRAVNDLVYAEIRPGPVRRISYGSDAPMLFDHLADRHIESYARELQALAPGHAPARRKK